MIFINPLTYAVIEWKVKVFVVFFIIVFRHEDTVRHGYCEHAYNKFIL